MTATSAHLSFFISLLALGCRAAPDDAEGTAPPDAASCAPVDASCAQGGEACLPIRGYRLDDVRGCVALEATTLGCYGGGKANAARGCYERRTAAGVERYFTPSTEWALAVFEEGVIRCEEQASSDVLAAPKCE